MEITADKDYFRKTFVLKQPPCRASHIFPSKQAPPPEVSQVLAGRPLDHVRREFEQAHLPPFVDALDDRAELVLRAVDAFTEAGDDLSERAVDDLLAHVYFPEL